MTASLAVATADADGDGRRDQDDACPETPAGSVIDQTGCSQAQFCASVDASTRGGQKLCQKADWKNDEPLMKVKTADCRVDKGTRGPQDDCCVPAQ